MEVVPDIEVEFEARQIAIDALNSSMVRLEDNISELSVVRALQTPYAKKILGKYHGTNVDILPEILKEVSKL